MNRKVVIYGLAVVIGIGAAFAMSYAADKRGQAQMGTSAIGRGAACGMHEGAGCGMKAAHVAGGTGGCGMHGPISPDAAPAALASEGGCPLHKNVAAESGEAGQCAHSCAEAHACTDACPDKAKEEAPTTDTGTEQPAHADTHLTT